MKITLEINESLWQYTVDQQNAVAQAVVDKANEQGATAAAANAARAKSQYDAIMAQTPETRRVPFVSPPTFVPTTTPSPVTIQQLVSAMLVDKEKQLTQAIVSSHLTVIQQKAALGDLALFVKVLDQDTQVQDALRTQVAALQ